MERRDVYVYFWIASAELAPTEVSKILGLQPSRTRTLGVQLVANHRSQNHQWTLNGPMPRGEGFLQDHIEALVAVLEQKAGELQVVRERAELGVNCVGYYCGAHPGLHLSASLVQRLAKLGLSIDFDLYNYADDNAP
jgi:phosphopantetheine adenylyltransferase